jgi:DNA recombination protein RmuC
MLSLSFIFLILALVIILLLLVLRLTKNQNANTGQPELIARIEYLERSLNRIEGNIKDDFRQNREELGNNLNMFQQGFLDTLKEISRQQMEQIKSMQEQNQQVITSMNKSLEEKLTQLADRFQLNAQQSREALDKSLKEFQESFSRNVKEFNEMQQQKFAGLEKKQAELITSTELKLEKMRETVDEKLQKTLETRLGQSFELVSKQLESVQKGLGEMQSLATDVGGLKKVLSNVKTRGVLGEIQLSNILEQILAPEQYEANVKTKSSSADHVEFAIRLPGKDDGQGFVYLPIDAKFPQESYYLLQQAYDNANPQLIEEATKSLASSITKFAKDISEKYLDPPNTTDFGIMFLPVEGLYAEIVRNTDLIEQLQRKYKIIVTGPTTLAAILNSLQMGFKTLAIQKRSSEVWQILGAVKTEFSKFGGILEKARKKIDEAGNEIDTLVGTRTKAIERKLRQVQEMPAHETKLLFDDQTIIEQDEEEV